MLEFEQYVKLRAKYHFYKDGTEILFRSRLHARKYINEVLIPRHPEYMFSISQTVNVYDEQAYRILMYAPYTIFDDFSEIYEKGELDDET